MTHDKELLDVKYSFSPVSLQDAEKPTQLERTLEKVVVQAGNEYLSAVLEENCTEIQHDKAISSALRNSMPGLLILGWMCSSPCA
jgi:hypothetical protein